MDSHVALTHYPTQLGFVFTPYAARLGANSNFIVFGWRDRGSNPPATAYDGVG